MFKNILLPLLLIGSISFAIISKPRNPDDRRPIPRPPIGIGKMEQNQSIVRHFMDHVGWDENTPYEETGFMMKKVLFKMVSENQEAKQWVMQMNEYFESKEFKRQDSRAKTKDIYQAKIYVKMSVEFLGILKGDPKFKN